MHRVLVVDDDPALLNFVSKALQDDGYLIDTATDIRSAFDVLSDHLPDLMILDLLFSEGSGFDALQALQDERRYDLVPIILLSGKDDLDAKVRALELGATDYLVKPLHPRELAARVRALIRLKDRYDHIFAEYLRLSELSLTDPLTSAYNRRAMEGLLRSRFSESARYGIPLSCVMMDIDHFKMVNDTYGHATGDRVLREMANLTLSHCRQEDALIRYGGEEFLVVLFHTSRNGARTFAERLCTQVASHVFDREQNPLTLTLSAGAATHPEDGEARDAETLVALADRRLYAAKRAGRNRVVSEG